MGRPRFFNYFSVSLTAYTKTISGGTDGLLVCDPLAVYQRETTLPANWKKIRLALFLSVTEPTDPNILTTQEGIDTTTYPSPLYDFAFGISNGVGRFGAVGNKFLGCVAENAPMGIYDGLAVSSYYGWHIAGNSYVQCAGVFSNGSVIVRSGTGYAGTFPVHMFFSTPEAATGFAFAWVVQLDVSTDGSLHLKTVNQDSITDVSDTAINALVNTEVVPGIGGDSGVGGGDVTITGGWWNSSTPVGCSHLYIRLPFPLHRLRIHNSRFKYVS